MGDHQRSHSALAVEPGERVGVVDQAGRSAQCAPQFVHDAEELPPRGQVLVGEHGGGVDHPERVGPGAEHRRGDELVTGGGHVGDVYGHGWGVQVDRGGGGLVEHAFE
jgi:hypothetical protein